LNPKCCPFGFVQYQFPSGNRQIQSGDQLFGWLYGAKGDATRREDSTAGRNEKIGYPGVVGQSGVPSIVLVRSLKKEQPLGSFFYHSFRDVYRRRFV
jgi:hypothetical protein